MKGTVNYSVVGNVAILEVDNPPVNPLSSGVRVGLKECFEKANSDDSITGIILKGAGNAFIAGADISEFGQKVEGPDLHTTLAGIELSEKPVVAAINGPALGGGLETALCCNYRIATQNSFVGLPEVNLGLLPGAGGTQRLPRIIGPDKALTIMLTAEGVQAQKALEMGILDEISNNDLIEDAINFLEKKIKQNSSHPKIRDANEMLVEARGNSEIIDKAKSYVAKARRGQFAPGQIIKCVESAINLDDFDEGMKKESEYFLECLMHPQREAMINVFFGQRTAAKIKDVPRETPTSEIKAVGIVGAGTMGGGIAMNFANAGIPVTILDQDQENIDRGMNVINKNYQFMVERGRMKEEVKNKTVALITPSLDYDSLKDCDIVIEAVYENLELKHKIFMELDKHVKPEAILATNTSGLDIDSISSVTNRPEKIVGTHFFSPANIMKLLEVVRGENTSNETLATVMKISKAIKKTAVVSLNAPGFIGNRMLLGYSKQANMLLLEGALPSQIDNAIEAFGLNMGPFRMMDLIGLDLGWRARKLAGVDSPLTNKIADTLCENERFGQKNSKGFYNYSEGSRAPNPAPENEEIYFKISEENGFTRREISDEEIVDRCILALVNEGAKILEEGVAQRASDMDIVYINGYGFPVWRGGPMFYANSLGLDKVLEKLKGFQEIDSDFWKPADLLEKLAKDELKFGEAPDINERKGKMKFPDIVGY